MIYTVTFNPSLDYIASVENFRTGRVNRTCGELIYPGGKGINVSMVLKNLGHESTALGFVAGFTGQEIRRRLGEKEIRADFIEVESGISRINVKLRSVESYVDWNDAGKSDDGAGNNNRPPVVESEVNGMGPAISENDIDKLYRKLDNLKIGDILVLAGSIPAAMPQTIYADIMRYIRKELKLGPDEVKIVVDATKDLLVNVLPYKPFLIKPNNHELGEIFGVEIREREEAVPYAKRLQKMGAANALVSMAGEGAVLAAQDANIYMSGAPKGIVRNSVGAGDSMVAGFLAGYLEGCREDSAEHIREVYRRAFYMGLCAGSASAFSDELADRGGVEDLLGQLL